MLIRVTPLVDVDIDDKILRFQGRLGNKYQIQTTLDQSGHREHSYISRQHGKGELRKELPDGSARTGFELLPLSRGLPSAHYSARKYDTGHYTWTYYASFTA